MGDKKRVMLIGWDAADWKVIHELTEKNRLPNISNMIEQGVMGNMRTLSPVLSPMLWTSIATGKRPFKHGIYGFTEPAPGGKAVQPMTNVSRRCKAVWNILNQNDMKSLVVGWWPSHPAEPINGVMVSDFFHKAPKKPGDPWKLMPGCIHPKSMTERLAEFRVHPLEMRAEHVLPFIPKATEVDQEVDSRLSVVMKMLAECTTIHATATELLEHDEWDFAAIYYDAIDHFCHGFMKYRAPRQDHIPEKDFELYKDVVTAAYLYHDMILGRLMELGGEDTTYILLSDHGFHPDHLRPRMLPSEPAGPALEHRDYGIFIAKGPGLKKDHIIHGANLLDVAPTILSIYGLPIGEDMDGQPLLDIFEDTPDIATIESWDECAGDDGQHPEGMAIDPSESKEALEQLVALGYIEPPDEDSGKAVADCQRELDYNLARSYMDAGMHGEAIPLLLNLYKNYPLEFRFGIQLSNCLRAMGRIDDLEKIVDDLNARWRIAAEEAKKRIGEISVVMKERREHWRELKKIDDENAGDETKPKLAQVDARGKPKIWEDHEYYTIRKIRGVARGNPQTLDFLSATIATSKGDFESALAHLENAKLTESKNPGFQFHVGHVFLGLERFKDAEDAFLRALEFDEFHPNALMGLTRTYVEQSAFKKAIDFGQQATGLKFHFPQAHYYLGLARKGVGDFDNAIKSLNTAIQQNPNFAEAHRALASIYKTAQIDEDLMKSHAAAARDLAAANQEINDSQATIELPSLDTQDFRKQLKSLDSFVDREDADFIRCIGQPRSTRLSAIESPPEVVIVSGLPRSGTSMMMQILQAGGIAPFTDESRVPDESNPRGYLEAEVVKQLQKKNNWVKDCDGKAIKVVAPLIPYLPQGVKYKVVFMTRDLSEILDSQTAMLEQLQKDGGDIERDRLGKIFSGQVGSAIHHLSFHKHEIFEAPYPKFVNDPAGSIAKLVEFFGPDFQLDERKMVEAIAPDLYRQQGST